MSSLPNRPLSAEAIKHHHNRLQSLQQFCRKIVNRHPGAVLHWGMGGNSKYLGFAPSPPNISAYRCKKEDSVTFKICQNAFLAWALPRTPLGELTTLPQTPLSAGEGTSLPIPYPLWRLNSPTFGEFVWGTLSPKYFLLQQHL